MVCTALAGNKTLTWVNFILAVLVKVKSLINSTTNREVWAMYVDEYVIAGLVIIALTIGFFGGVYRFIKNDMAKHAADKQL